jgi:hypothetical protein
VKALLVAWFASALAFSGAMLSWMFLTAWIEGAVLPQPVGIARGGLFALVLGLIFQFGYGEGNSRIRPASIHGEGRFFVGLCAL